MSVPCRLDALVGTNEKRPLRHLELKLVIVTKGNVDSTL